jgi:lipid-binding SYLF domain-containing protein
MGDEKLSRSDASLKGKPPFVMKTMIRNLVVSGGLLLAASYLHAEPNTLENLRAASSAIPDEKDRNEVQATLASFASNPKLADFFASSYGVVVFPTVAKGGLGIGGAHGSGVGFRQGKYDGTVTMNQVTVGFQAGGQAFSQVIFFADEASFNKFASGEFELGAQASAVALTAGANASASTAGGASAGMGDAQAKAGYTDGLAIFTMAKGGLMYEASVGGQKFKYRAVTN